jgi:hypothetical protein
MRSQMRNWLTATLAIGFLIVLAAILGSLTAQRRADYYLQRPSSFFTDASGARALLLVMKRLLPSVEQWRRRLRLLPPPDKQDTPSTLIVAGPRRPITETEVEYLDRWLAQGGQLILATDNGWPVRRGRPTNQEEPEEPSSESAKRDQENQRDAKPRDTYLSIHAPGIRWSKPEKIHTQRITGVSVPDGELILQWRRKFSTVADAKVIAAAGEAVIAVEIPVGQGRIVALADSTIVSNRALREADNAIWLVTLAGSWGNGRVLIDEYHHGFGQQRSAATLTWAFMKTPWGWCVLQIAAAGLLYIFAYCRRFGRISELPPPERSSPLELIEARAGVFQAAAAQGLATELIVKNVSHELAKASGQQTHLSDVSYPLQPAHKSDGSAKRLAALRALHAKAASGEKLKDEEFVELGRIAGEIVQGVIS